MYLRSCLIHSKDARSEDEEDEYQRIYKHTHQTKTENRSETTHQNRYEGEERRINTTLQIDMYMKIVLIHVITGLRMKKTKTKGLSVSTAP